VGVAADAIAVRDDAKSEQLDLAPDAVYVPHAVKSPLRSNPLAYNAPVLSGQQLIDVANVNPHAFLAAEHSS
jgi:hypothetical protein